jgi:WD40 repeat protein/uncharacterized caspase-like protein
MQARRSLARRRGGIAARFAIRVAFTGAVCLAMSFGGGPPARAEIVREEADPILRLDLPGHTGEVRALAFTPDGSRLVSGGRDKVAIAWTLDDEGAADDAADGDRLTRNIARRRLKERAYRWQVARGTRGAIQALAVSAGAKPLVAMAGSGAMGSTGEILLLDAVDGTLVKTLGGNDRVGHRQSVVAVAFTPDGEWLLSQDLDGQAFAWSRKAEWNPVELASREETRLGAKAAAALLKMPPLRPLAVCGNDRVILPVLTSPADAATPVWKLQVVNPADPAKTRLLPREHFGVVTALAPASDGRSVISADYAGHVHLIPLEGDGAARTFDVKPVAEAVAGLANGLIAVAVAAGEGSPPRLEIWDPAKLQRLAARPAAAPVRVVQSSRDGTWLAWGGGERHSVHVERTADVVKPLPEGEFRPRGRLGGVGQNITRIAFSTAVADDRPPADESAPQPGQRNVVRRRKPPAAAGAQQPAAWPRRLAIATAAAGRPAALEAAFNVETLARIGVGAEGDWAPAAGRPGPWSLRLAVTQSQGLERWELVRDGAPAGTIDLALDWQGRLGGAGNAVSWIAKPGDVDPQAVAVGTDRGIFVYGLEAEAGKACALWRRFRGHEDRVLALAVSEDGRWLASGAGDGLTMLWSLSGLERRVPLNDRWGIALRVENGKAIVDQIDEAGPLAGKDVRAGDVIAKVSWSQGKETRRTEHVAGAAIAAALADVPWGVQVTFATERDGKARDGFLRLPAWENLAALHLAPNREWAFWTPRGYYAASANGDTLFGWLVNRGVDRLPRFFKAQQFRRRLERPDVMSRLLAAGSLDAALRAAKRDVPESSALVLPQQIAAAPEVRIIAPAAGEAAKGGTIAVRAEVEIPAGVQLDRVQSSANGVPAAARPRILEDVPAVAGRPARRVYAWEQDLPAEDRHLINVFAGTRDGPSHAASVPVDAAAEPPLRSREPRLYLIASGIDDYAHSDRFENLGLTDLEFAVKDARFVRDSLAQRSLELYDLAAEKLLANREVTRAGWKKAVEELAGKLKGEVEPDDLVVVFLAGHGMTNVAAERAYAYLCQDAELTVAGAEDEPVPSRDGALGWQDFQILADVPCRKLALVDTCHSGALGPAARSATIREFQENMIVILAAAADDEPSQESDAWGHGAFTKILLEALSGRADVGRSRLRAPRTSGMAGDGGPPATVGGRTRPDGVVSIDEVIDYVIKRVPELTRRGHDEDTAQHPTVSPEEIVPFVNLPVARVLPAAP